MDDRVTDDRGGDDRGREDRGRDDRRADDRRGDHRTAVALLTRQRAAQTVSRLSVNPRIPGQPASASAGTTALTADPVADGGERGSDVATAADLVDGARRGSVRTEADPHPAAALDSAGDATDLRPPVYRRASSWRESYLIALAVTDLVLAVAALLVGQLLHDAISYLGAIPAPALTLAACWPIAIGAMRGYRRSDIGVGSQELRAVLRAMVVAGFAAGFAAALLPENWIRSVMVTLPMIAVASLIARVIARRWLHHRQRKGAMTRSVIVVGTGPSVADLVTVFNENTASGMRVVAACISDRAPVPALPSGIPIVGDVDHVAAAVREFNADAVAVTAGTPHGYLRTLAWALEGSRVDLLVDPGLIEVAGPRLHIQPFVGLPLLQVEEPEFTGWRRILKSSLDLTLAVVALLVLAPLFVITAMAIKLEDRGPVFYRQTRIGKGGKEFRMWKFRSMHTGADQRVDVLADNVDGNGVLYKNQNDPRITRVGRFIRRYSIDELPQLFNVLGRTMSLVGPRPCLERELALLETAAHRRLLVTPGLTGLWQINGRSDLSADQSVRLDLRYVENWTLSGDLLILWKTVFAVLSRRGAY